MKKYLIQSIKVIAIAILIGSGTFAVSAWTAPTVNPPATGVVRVPANDTAQGVFAALNTTVFPQIKKGGLIISEENKYLVSPLSFFKKVLLPEEDTSVYVGGVGTADPTFATAANFPEDRSVPLTINMSGRSSEGAIKYVADTDACAGPTKIITDSSAFQFWNDGENDHADILAKGIRLTGGNPAAGKILISVDRDGRAVWATPRLAANGVDILFDTDTSPVGSCNPVAPVYTWEEKGDWGVCNIDTLQQTQTVVCKNESGMEVNESLCDPTKKPSTTKSCNIEAPICTGGNYTPISTPTCDFNTYVKRTTRDTPDNPDATSEAGVYSAKGCLVRKSGYIAGAADQCQFIPVEDVSDVPAAAPSGYVFASSCKETVNAGQYENTYQLGKINNCQVTTPTCTSANTYKITRYKNGVVDETFGPAPLGPCYFKVVNETRYLGGGGRGCFIVPADEFYPERDGGTWYETHTDIGYTCQVINTHNSGDYVTYKIEKHP
jgi:hypothetical protein